MLDSPSKTPMMKSVTFFLCLMWKGVWFHQIWGLLPRSRSSRGTALTSLSTAVHQKASFTPGSQLFDCPSKMPSSLSVLFTGDICSWMSPLARAQSCVLIPWSHHHQSGGLLTMSIPKVSPFSLGLFPPAYSYPLICTSTASSLIFFPSSGWGSSLGFIPNSGEASPSATRKGDT